MNKAMLVNILRGICVLCTLAAIAAIPVGLYLAVKQSRDCKARGGYQVGDLGCVDLKKIQRR